MESSSNEIVHDEEPMMSGVERFNSSTSSSEPSTSDLRPPPRHKKKHKEKVRPNRQSRFLSLTKKWLPPHQQSLCTWTYQTNQPSQTNWNKQPRQFKKPIQNQLCRESSKQSSNHLFPSIPSEPQSRQEDEKDANSRRAKPPCILNIAKRSRKNWGTKTRSRRKLPPLWRFRPWLPILGSTTCKCKAKEPIWQRKPTTNLQRQLNRPYTFFFL